MHLVILVVFQVAGVLAALSGSFMSFAPSGLALCAVQKHPDVFVAYPGNIVHYVPRDSLSYRLLAS